MEMNSIADWEEWVELARQNPEKFERERKAAIEKLIMSQPAQYRHRSRQLQWKIDAVRRLSPNALSSCIRIHDMLMDSFYGPNGLLQAINLLGNADGEAARTTCPIKAGRCIEFHKKRAVDPGA